LHKKIKDRNEHEMTFHRDTTHRSGGGDREKGRG